MWSLMKFSILWFLPAYHFTISNKQYSNSSRSILIERLTAKRKTARYLCVVEVTSKANLSALNWKTGIIKWYILWRISLTYLSSSRNWFLGFLAILRNNSVFVHACQPGTRRLVNHTNARHRIWVMWFINVILDLVVNGWSSLSSKRWR